VKDQKPDYSWIAENLESIRTTQPDGTPAFIINPGGVNYDDLINILSTYEPFDQDASDIQRERLIREAIRAAAAAGKITAQALIRELSRQKTLYSRSNRQAYILLTSLSLQRPADLLHISFDNAQFSFSDTVPRTFSREEFKLHQIWEPPKDLPPAFTKVRVKVKARSEVDAYETAVNSLDYLRGIWNFAINRAFTWKWHSGPARPVNSIFLGPVHTLHDSTGKITTPMYRYEAVYPPEVEAANLTDWQRIKTDTKKIRSLISRHSYKGFMRQVFIRYARSLDSNDHESSFLKLWSLLEWLTGISNEQNYDEVIKRVVFLFEDAEYHRQVLEHLRIRRNNSVHGGKGIFNAESLIYQIKLYVEWMILNHLGTRGRYKTPQEFGQMLSSPLDPNALQDRLEELGHQMKLLRAAQILRAKKVEPTQGPPPKEDGSDRQTAPPGGA
jgi:hypothetical protein